MAAGNGKSQNKANPKTGKRITNAHNVLLLKNYGSKSVRGILFSSGRAHS
jgi:hypothetical protein